MSKVERPFLGFTDTSDGQPAGGDAAWPGVLEYRHKTPIPNPTDDIHRATAATVTAGFFNLVGSDISKLRSAYRRSVHASVGSTTPTRY